MNSINEPELLRLLYTLADLHQWISDLTTATLSQVPHMGKKKLQKLDYYLSVRALVHILERHYYKIPRHPGAAKFCIPIGDILGFIRQAKDATPQQAPGHSGSYRIMDCNTEIGYNRQGEPTTHITVFTDIKGNILTAFPGKFEPAQNNMELPAEPRVCDEK